jgi:hypothetical protein
LPSCSPPASALTISAGRPRAARASARSSDRSRGRHCARPARDRSPERFQGRADRFGDERRIGPARRARGAPRAWGPLEIVRSPGHRAV